MEKNPSTFELAKKSTIKKLELPIPTNPVVMAALRALYAGGPRNRWLPDSFGRPYYRYNARDGRVTLFFTPPPDFGSRFDLSKAMYYTPRLALIYSGSLRAAVQGMSVETTDVFLILMARIAQLRDPARDIAKISLDEIAQFRGVNLRHGSAQNLHDDFKKEILRLADLCLTMTWRDYEGGGSVTYGRQIPDRLLDIVDIEYKQGRETWTALRSVAVALSKPRWPALDRLLQPFAVGAQPVSRGVYKKTSHLLDNGGHHSGGKRIACPRHA